MAAPTPESPSGPPCLFVIGMHRSGTSAITASLADLGLTVPAESGRIPPSPWNERGNFESRALTDLNERLLRRLGGTWTGPPDLETGWETRPTLDRRRARAGPAFRKTFPTRPMVWKDPRNCITLPFWRSVVAPPMAAVFVYRDPLEVARSLEARDGVTLTYGLALWDRYVRSAAANLVGLPTLLADYASVLDQPRRWAEEVTDFLGRIGAAVSAPSQPEVVSLAADLRHQRADGDRRPASDLSDSQFAVLAALRAMNGAHFPWPGVDLASEPAWVDDVLAIRRKADKLRRELTRAERLSQTSLLFRVTRRLGNLRPRS